MDHTAVKAAPEKHAHWWSRVYGRGVKEVRILYHAGRENRDADAPSGSLVFPAPEVGLGEDELQVSCIHHHQCPVVETPQNVLVDRIPCMTT